MGALQRFRHSRGFGVHSPFAFRFILEVLRERLPYYDYRQLPDAQSRLAYRLSAFLQPSAVKVDGSADQIAKAARMATNGHAGHPPAWTGFSPAPLFISGPDASPDAVIAAIADGCNAMMLYADKAALQRVIGSMAAGMVFDNEKDLAIIISTPKLPKQYFALNLPR